MDVDTIKWLLPEVLRTKALPGTVLYGFLETMQDLMQDSVAELDLFQETIEPMQGNPDTLKMLAGWVGFPLSLIAESKNVASRVMDARYWTSKRGTAQGLGEVLQLLTGSPKVRIELKNQFELEVFLPPEVDIDFVESILYHEKPVHVTHVIKKLPHGSEVP